MSSFLAEYGDVEAFDELVETLAEPRLESLAEPAAEGIPQANPDEPLPLLAPKPKAKASVSAKDLLKALRMQRYLREQRAEELAHEKEEEDAEEDTEEEEEDTKESDEVISAEEDDEEIRSILKLAAAEQHVQPAQQPAQQHVQPAQQPVQQHVQPASSNSSSALPAEHPAQHVQPAQQPPQQRSGDLQEEVVASDAGLRSYRAAEAAIRSAAGEAQDVDTAVAAYNMAEADAARQNQVPWRERGPRGDGQPTVWRNQNWRAGSARYANRGGQRREEFARYFAAKAKANAKGKGQSGSAELSKGQSKGKAEAKAKGKGKRKGSPRDAAAPYPASETAASQLGRQRLMYLFCFI